MVNKSKKGYGKEKRARDELKAEGWSIVFKSTRWRFGVLDYASLFDIVSLKGKTYPQHQEEIRKFKEEHGLGGESYELWIWSKPRWRGRGKKRAWNEGHWDKIII